MSEPIKVGDLVYVVRCNKCCGHLLGLIFTVTAIRLGHPRGKWKCGGCGASGFKPNGQVNVADGHPICGIGVSKLKRIPPLSELEGEKRDERITA